MKRLWLFKFNNEEEFVFLFDLNKKTWSSNNKGLSIVEVVFASAIISVLLMSIIVLSVQAVDMSKKINYEYAATNMAKSRIENGRMFIEKNGFDALTQVRYGEVNTRLDHLGVPDASGDFLRSTTVVENYNANERLTNVTVTIKYYYRGTLAPSTVVSDTVFSKIDVVVP